MAKILLMAISLSIGSLYGCATKHEPVQQPPKFQEITPGQQSLISPPARDAQQIQPSIEEKNI